ncbi:MAG: hypothetical protein ABIO78_01145 [Thermoanaerobaculia bacterium]
MNSRSGAGLAAVLFAAVLAAGCTGGQEGTAAEEPTPSKNGVNAESAKPSIDPRKALDSVSSAIPLYAGAKYRDDLTRRDQVMIRNQYGPGAEVYTLATNDSFPQVYHYYTTYLAQFRAFPAQSPYPPERQDWRTLEVQLNQAMQDPFIPGQALQIQKQVTLQIAETEAEPKTVIRYIVSLTAPIVATTPTTTVPATAAASQPQAPAAAPAVAR